LQQKKQSALSLTASSNLIGRTSPVGFVSTSISASGNKFLLFHFSIFLKIIKPFLKNDFSPIFFCFGVPKTNFRFPQKVLQWI
jgi:hypothetical protein